MTRPAAFSTCSARVRAFVVGLAAAWYLATSLVVPLGAHHAPPCVYGPEYWATHPRLWPVDSLVLGNPSNPAHTYQKGELLALLRATPRADASVFLAAQLIAAQLNVARGSNPAPIARTLTEAQAILAGVPARLPLRVKPASRTGLTMAALGLVLDAYNRGRYPGACGVNVKPIADAGPDQAVRAGSRVTLDGTGSADPDGDALTYAWTLVRKPAGSTAVLSSPTSPRPSFMADVRGTYVISLVVKDGRITSKPDEVCITTTKSENARPVADAGADRTVRIGDAVRLDGSRSSDPDGDPLTFAWTLASVPDGSAATLADPNAIAPTLLVDLPGAYAVQLIVSDGRLASEPAVVVVSTANSTPVARAGADATGTTGQTVTLDGSASSDVDGDALTFDWSFVSRPSGSRAVLSDTTAVTPSFVIDRVGIYVVQLVVHDGAAFSEPDTVVVTTTNTRPTAAAGPDQEVSPGTQVTLDGSGSTDVDGQLLTYAWALTSRPDGSTAALSDPTAVRPVFVADLPGTYVAQLVVHDGSLESAPDTVTVVTTAPPNHPPTAEAGADQTVASGATVQLDGTASSDPDGDPLTFAWTLIGRPSGSSAALSAATTASPFFVADRPGTYVAQLIANDGQADSAPDTVTISTRNSLPLASAGADQAVAPGTTVQLDGSASSDPDGDPLVYTWSLLSVPAGSTATLSSTTIAAPTFVADRAGLYVAQLVVGDGRLVSAPDTVTIAATTGPTAHAGPDRTVAVTARVTLDGSASIDPDGDALTYAWSLVSRPAGSTAVLSDATVVRPAFTADIAGAYVWQLVVNDGRQASAPDTVTITAQPGADLRLWFELVQSAPLVGGSQDVLLRLDNPGPLTVSDIAVHIELPAGYGPVATSAGYDRATSTWTIPSLIRGNFTRMSISGTVLPTGPYDFDAAIVSRGVPDPNPDNDTAHAAVTANPTADLSIRFFEPPAGNRPTGQSVQFFVEVHNDGPAAATGVVVHFAVPSGYAVSGAAPANYDRASGTWTIGTLTRSAVARLVFQGSLNATGPVGLSAAIVAYGGRDPNLLDNAVTAPGPNRAPAANAGLDRAVAAGTLVTLDGSATSDPDGDPMAYLWAMARPGDSAATLSGATTVAPTFVPDRPGVYRIELLATDSRGFAGVVDGVVITVAGESRAPRILSTPPTAASVGQPYHYAVRAADPDAGDILTYSLAQAPAGMTIDPLSGLVQWTPAAGQGGPAPTSVRVQDQRGLIATQAFAVQVSSPANQAPVAVDDGYEARSGESLSIPAPGLLANDADADGTPLRAVLRSAPRGGELLQGADGAFVYTPHDLQPGGLIRLSGVNLANRLPGVVAEGSSNTGVFAASMAIDGDPWSSWRGAFVARTTPPVPLDVVFPQDVTVDELRIIGHRVPGFIDISLGTTEGYFELLDAAGTSLYNSGALFLPIAGDIRQTVPGGRTGVRRVRFMTTNGGGEAGFGELEVIGSALVRRPNLPEINLGQRLPTKVIASATASPNIPESVIDDNLATNWYSPSAGAGQFIELQFPVDVTVNQIVGQNPSARPDGFGTSIPIDCSGRFTLLSGEGSLLFDSGVVHEPAGGLGDFPFTVPIPNVGGVRRVRYTSDGCVPNWPVGFAELRVIGTSSIETPPVSLATKFQALSGREIHSTPLVVNLTDDDFDGAVTTNDVPDIVVAAEGRTNQLAGEIKVVSGDDGRELMTMGGPNLVSPWAEPAAGDIDGDGVPEVIAVQPDGQHLIAFEHTGQVKWVSQANAMPVFLIGGTPVITGAVSIANLDASGPPEIIVGASVFRSDGSLVGDGRTLGGTTGGTGMRSAISVVADLDLDGVPELIAGPTAYHLVDGTLRVVWRRADRPDGFAAVGNFDDDPFPEIAIVAAGQVYLLNHDGTDAQTWNAPSHAPVPLPAGGLGGAPTVADLDGDGVPEIGVAAAAYYVVFNRTGVVRWAAAISDRSSNSTGSTVFDLDGDGEVEIIYRDEKFLRVLRGRDGVLLAKTPLESATWAEMPVVADVDRDGHAEIVVTSDIQANVARRTGVWVFEDIADQWTRTRGIWNQQAYHVTNVNDDGTIPLVETAGWLVPGLNAFRLNAFVPGGSDDGSDSFTYVASDGVLESEPATVQIAIRTPNSAPRITSTPVIAAAHGVVYTYAVQADDPDAGDIQAYALVSGPAGMHIDPASGLVQWTPTAAQAGRQDALVKVADLRGLFALQAFAIVVSAPATVPDVVGRTQADAGAVLSTAGLAAGGLSSRFSQTIAAGRVLGQSPAAGTFAAPGAAVSLVVSLGPAPAGTVPNVVAQSQASATADVTAAGFVLALPVGGRHSATVPLGIVLAQTPVGGTVATAGSTIALVVSLGPPPGGLDADGDGFTGDAGDCNDGNPAIHPGAVDVAGDGIDQNCNGVDSIPGDATLPLASIAAPADLAVVTVPTDVFGSATDDHLLRYTLTLTAVDQADGITIGSGTSAVAVGVLGRIDPTRLENGLYRVTVSAEDVNGQIAVDERVYRVDGQAKVGAFTVSFVDLQVPVSGIPITVVRTYDSRVKTTRDFGVGWSLQVKTGSVQHNRAPGDGWVIGDRGGPFDPPCTVVTEPRAHVTEVRLSDRESYVFRPRLTGVAAVVGGCTGQLVFDFVTGTVPGATLQPLDGRDFLFTPGDPRLFVFDGGESTGLVLDPRRVRLTTVDGRKVDLERGAGVTRVEDANGNALVLSNAGVVHSAGRSIVFTRDAAGRLTRITDPLGRTLAYGYVDGDLTSFTDQAGAVTSYVYDGAHNLTEIRDPLGRQAVRAEYDADGRLIATTDARGARMAFAHDLDGREEIVTDALGHPTRVVYDERGNVRSQQGTVTIDGAAVVARTTFEYDGADHELARVDPDGRRTETAWDAFGNPNVLTVDPLGLRIQRQSTFAPSGDLLAERDPNGDTMRYALDRAGNAVTWTDVDGRATAIGYDAAGNVTRFADPAGSTTTVTYDRDGHPQSRLDAAGAVTTYTYDAAGNRLTETVARTIDGTLRQLTTRYEYDARNRLIRTIDPVGGATSTIYDATGRVASTIDVLGRATTFTHDEVGDLVRIVYPDGSDERREYDARGSVIRTVDRDGLVTTYVYDELGRRVSTTGPDGGVVRTVYSAGGQELAVVAADGARTDYEYDAAGRRVLVREPQVTVGSPGVVVRPEWHYEYDAGGRLTAETDPRGQRKTISYDTAARSVSVRLPDGAVSSEQRDPWGRPVRRVDQDGQAVTFSYLGDTGLLTGVTQPAATAGQPQGVWSFQYDEAGNRTTQRDPLGRLTRFAYDEMNRVRRITMPGGGVRTLTRDLAGRVTQLSDYDGSVATFQYDLADRLTRRHLADGSEVAFTYTPGGRRQSATDARGVTTFRYDAAGRLDRVEQPAVGAVGYGYDAAGRVAAITTPAGTTTYGFAAGGRLSSVAAASGTTQYRYDLAGNVVAQVQPNGVSADLTYDARNQLTSLTYARAGSPFASFGYAYTPSGRRSSASEPGATTSFTYDGLGRLIGEARVGSTPRSRQYEYDLVGNRTRTITDGVPVLSTYDADDRLLTAGSMAYAYDGRGNPTSRNQAGALTTFAWTPDNRLASVTTPSGRVGFAYDADGLRVSRTAAGATTRFLVDGFNPSGLRQVLEARDGAGALLTRNTFGLGLLETSVAGQDRVVVSDGQGSVRQLTDAAGVTTDQYASDAFGNALSETGSTPNPYRYLGQETDAATGLIYMRERYYDPVIGRFLGRDPLDGDPLQPLSMHRYAYAGNDPVNFADPNGDFFTLLGFSFASLAEGGLRGLDAGKQLPAFCRVKGLAKILPVAIGLRQAVTQHSAIADKLVGLLSPSLSVGSLRHPKPSASVSTEIGLYQHVFAKFLPSPPQYAGELKKASLRFIVKPPDATIQLNAENFPANSVSLGLNCRIYPTFGFKSFEAGGGAEKPIFDLRVCGLLSVGTLSAYASVGVAANDLNFTGSAVDVGLKLSAPFFPGLKFSVLKLPDDLH